jgi:hypothetical protein
MFKSFYNLWDSYPLYYPASGTATLGGSASYTIVFTYITAVAVQLILYPRSLTRFAPSYKVTKPYQTVKVFPHPAPGRPQWYRSPTTATMGFQIPIRQVPPYVHTKEGVGILLPVKKPLEPENPANPYLVQAYGNNSKLTMRNPGKLFPANHPPKVTLAASPYRPPVRRKLNPNLPINTPWNSNV